MRLYLDNPHFPNPRIPVAQHIGAAIGRLHSADIVHGDLTTSNMLWRADNI
ncbi:hypothetical protein SARC_14197, partial [Sphaeroforma arctica JP610]